MWKSSDAVVRADASADERYKRFLDGERTGRENRPSDGQEVRNPLLSVLSATTIHLMALLTLAAAVVTAPPAHSWSMGTHAYITERCLAHHKGSELMNQAIYGAILPDLVSSYYVLDRAQSPVVREITHVSRCSAVELCSSGCKETQAFAQGWLAHGEVCGADVCAHIRDPLVARATCGYVETKAALLKELPPDAAHFCIETAIDMLVRRNLDPLIGRKVTEAARMRDARIGGVLVKACCPPLDALTLSRAELVFRWTAAAYGDTLSLPAPVDRLAAAAMFSRLAGNYTGRWIPFGMALRSLDQAMAVCEPDYRQVIEKTIEKVTPALAAARRSPGLSQAPPSRPSHRR